MEPIYEDKCGSCSVWEILLTLSTIRSAFVPSKSSRRRLPLPQACGHIASACRRAKSGRAQGIQALVRLML